MGVEPALTTVERLREQRRDLQEKFTQALEQHERTQAELAAARADEQRQSEEAEALREEVENRAMTVTSSMGVEPILSQVDRLRAERDDTQEEHDLMLEQHEQARAELAAARAEEQRQSEEAGALREEVEKLEQLNEEIGFRNDELEEQKRELETQLDTEAESREAEDQSDDDASAPENDSDDGIAPEPEPEPAPELLEEHERLRGRVAELERKSQELKTEVEELQEKNRAEVEARVSAQKEERKQKHLAGAAERRCDEALQARATLAEEHEELQRKLQRYLQLQVPLQVSALSRMRTEMDVLERSTSTDGAQSLASSIGAMMMPEPEPESEPESEPGPHTDMSQTQGDDQKLAELKELEARVQELEALSRDLQTCVQEMTRRTMEVYENERRPIRESSWHPSASPEGFHSSTLYPLLDRKHFSDLNGTQLENPSESPDAMLPGGEGWKWDGEWALDTAGADSDGWQYSLNFLLTPWEASFNPTCHVRRRRWVRQAINTATQTSSDPLSVLPLGSESAAEPSMSAYAMSVFSAAIAPMLSAKEHAVPAAAP